MADVARVLIPGVVGDVNPDNLTAAQQCQAAVEAVAADREAVEEAAAQVSADKGVVVAATAAATDAGQAVESAVALVISPPITAPETSRIVSSSDYGRILRFTADSAVTVTLPANAPVGTLVNLIQAGAGVVTCVAGSGAMVEGDALGRRSTYGRRSSATAWVDSNTTGSSAVWFMAGLLGG